MIEVWQLTVHSRDGQTLSVFGPRAGLEAAHDEWLESAASCDGIGAAVISVSGHCNSADRAPMRLSVRAGDISIMTLARYS